MHWTRFPGWCCWLIFGMPDGCLGGSIWIINLISMPNTTPKVWMCLGFVLEAARQLQALREEQFPWPEVQGNGLKLGRNVRSLW